MPAHTSTLDSGARSGDALFGAVPKSAPALAPGRLPEARPVRSLLASSAPTPSPLGELTDLRAERNWLQEERKRLEADLLKQLGAVKEEREKLVAQEAKINEALALRQHRLKRQHAILVARVEALQKREQELAEREAALAAGLEKVSRAEQELQALQDAAARLRQENKAQLALAEQARTEAAQFQEQAQFVRSELATLEEERQKCQKAWEQEKAEQAVGRAQMEQRYNALEKAERGLTRRTIDLDDLELKLQGELEKREQDLGRKQQRVERLWRAFKLVNARKRKDHEAERALAERYRQEVTQLKEQAEVLRNEHQRFEEARAEGRRTWEAEQGELRVRSVEFEQRHQALETAEKDLQRRAAEMEEAEARLRREREQTEQELGRGRRELELLGAKMRTQAQQIEKELSQIFGAENWRSVLGLLAPSGE